MMEEREAAVNSRRIFTVRVRALLAHHRRENHETRNHAAKLGPREFDGFVARRHRSQNFYQPKALNWLSNGKYISMANIPQNQLIAVIEVLNEVVATGLDRDAVCQLVTERAMTLTNASGAVMELTESEEMIYHRVCGSAVKSVGLRLRRNGSLSGLCVEMRTPLYSDNTEIDDRVDGDACRRVGVSSMICVPLFHCDRAIGVLKVISSKKCAFTSCDTEVLALLAKIIGSSMANAEKFAEARHQSRHDPLTGISNRRVYIEDLRIEFVRASRYGHPLTLALLDLDGFKAVNDAFGHPAGDQVLRRVANALSKSVRAIDRCFRIGGDEFAVLLPETSLEDAERVLHRVNQAIHQLGDAIGISAGVAEASAFKAADEFHAAVDAKLYEVKKIRTARVRLPA